MKKLYLLLTALIVVLIAGCGSHRLADYANTKPKFDLKAYFDRPVLAHGVITDRSGKVTRTMVVNIKSTWNGNVGTLDEDFVYSDGKTEKRVWTIRKDGDRYTGTAADVVGEAQGEAVGHAFNWKYVLAFKTDDGKIYNIDLDDWMWQVDEKVVINRAEFSKFGFKLGEIIITFTKLP
jgi:hypothetical protein